MLQQLARAEVVPAAGFALCSRGALRRRHHSATQNCVEIQPRPDPERLTLHSHVDRILTQDTGTCMCVVIQPHADKRVM